MSIQNSSFNKEIYHFLSFIVRVVTIFHYNQKPQYVLLIQIFLIFTFGSMLVKLKNMACFLERAFFILAQTVFFQLLLSSKWLLFPPET